MINEQVLVDTLVTALKEKGFCVFTEISNFYRSADIVVIDKEEKLWIIECKISDIAKAIKQLKTHRLSADKVYICTPFRKTKPNTMKRIENEGMGLIYIKENGEINFVLESYSNPPWELAKNKIFNRVKELI